MKESVSNDAATSICTALRAKQVNITPYLFTLDLPCFTSKGQKQSTPTEVNGGSSGEILLNGKSAICWLAGTARTRLQTTHLAKIFHIAMLAPVIQYFWCSFASIWVLPPWPTSLCTCLRMRSEICRSLVNMIGCFDSSGIAALLSLPPTLKMPLSSFGFSLYIWLVCFTF